MNKTKTISLALLTMFFWGSLFPMVKVGFAACNIETTADILLFAGFRFTVCGMFVSLFNLIRNKKSFIPVKTSLFPILLAGTFSVILHYSFTYLGLQLTDSSKTSILKQIAVLF